MKLKTILSIALLLAAFLTLKATHLTHGGLYYEYLGEDNLGNWEYKVTMMIYRDCESSQVEFDDEITIGVFDGGDPSKNIKRLTIKRLFETNAQPLIIGNVGGNFCFRKTRYSQIVKLPKSQMGYYVVWNRCCKTTSNNLIDDMASNYTVFIPNEPNTLAEPYFGGIIGLTTNTLTNVGVGYYDIDGDSISYSLTELLHGPLNGQNPIWDGSFNPTPIERVKYRSGFTAQKPLGQTGICSVSENGVLKLYTDKSGRYFIGVKVSEWRNGKLLTEQIRELYVLVFSSIQTTTQAYLSAEGFERKEIRLNFGMAVKSLDADSFTVEKRLKGVQNWNYLATIKADNYGFNDTSVLYDTLYQYQVTAHLNNGSSKASNISEAIVRSWRTNSIAEIQVNKFTVYPNPVSNMLYINSVNQIDINMVTITDIQGKVVLQNKNVSDVLTNGINVSPLPQGVYLLKVVAKNGSIKTQKIIKQ